MLHVLEKKTFTKKNNNNIKMAMSKEDLDKLKDEEKFKELFHKLDTNGDGTIQFSELIDALHLKSVKDAKSHAEVR